MVFAKRRDKWLWCDPTNSHHTHIWSKRDTFVQSKNHTHIHDKSRLHKKQGPAGEQMIQILGPRNRGETTSTKTTLIFCYFFWVIFAFGKFCLDCIVVPGIVSCLQKMKKYECHEATRGGLA